MKKLLHLVSFALLLSLPVAILDGCKSTLETGGAYAPATTNDVTGVVTPTQAPDKAFFIADATFYTAYNIIDAAFTFEKNNRDALWAFSPDVKHALDAIRPKAVLARNEYISARKAYIANPTPAGLSGLQTVLAKVTQLQSAAEAAIANFKSQ